jgi:hypothetical protein
MSDDVARYQVELFHGQSGLRAYQEAGIVECKPGEFLPISGFLGGLMGAIVAHVEIDDASQFDDYEICIFIQKVPEKGGS